MEDNENINNDDLMNSSMFASGGEDDGSFDSIFGETPNGEETIQENSLDESLNETSSMFDDTTSDSLEPEKETTEEPTKKEEAKEETPNDFANLIEDKEEKAPQKGEPKETPIQVIDEGDSNDDSSDENPSDVITVRPVKFKKFEETPPIRTIKKNLDIMQDILMHVSVELGRTKSSIKEVMDFKQGSIVELDKIAGEQVEVFVNGKLVAKGEVIVIEDRFGVRITSTNVSKAANL